MNLRVSVRYTFTRVDLNIARKWWNLFLLGSAGKIEGVFWYEIKSLKKKKKKNENENGTVSNWIPLLFYLV